MLRRRAVVLAVAFSVPLTTPAFAISNSDNNAPEHVTYQVITRTGGLVSIAALKWVPRGATTVLLAVHGSGGVKENNWAPLNEGGYSFAIARYHEGRATVAIDLPGYGESGGGAPFPFFKTDFGGIEDYAFVVEQIALQLRHEFPKVVGVGHSVGALLVDVAQGLFRPFDAIIPASWSHGGWSAQDKANTCNPTPCADIRDILFYRPNADPKVVDDFVSKLETFGIFDALNFGVWGGYWTRPGPVTVAPDDVTATITVPVLIIMGEKDWIFDDQGLLDEYKHFPSSNDVTQVNLPNTGHCVFHHLNHDFVEDYVGTWLDDRGL